MKTDMEEEFSDGELTAEERKHLRAILKEDAFGRELRRVVKVWLVTIGMMASAITATKLLLWDNVIRPLLLKQ